MLCSGHPGAVAVHRLCALHRPHRPGDGESRPVLDCRAGDYRTRLLLAVKTVNIHGPCRAHRSKIMDLGLKRRRAVVTGASRGIGRAIALALAAEGAEVVAAARNAEKLRELVASVQPGAGTISAHMA